MNLSLMLSINEIPISSQQDKKGFFIVKLRPFMKYHSPPCFSSRNITKNAETRPPPMSGVIIEQPRRGKLRYQGVAYHPSSSPAIFPNKLYFAVRIGNTNVFLTWIC